MTTPAWTQTPPNLAGDYYYKSEEDSRPALAEVYHDGKWRAVVWIDRDRLVPCERMPSGWWSKIEYPHIVLPRFGDNKRMPGQLDTYTCSDCKSTFSRTVPKMLDIAEEYRFVCDSCLGR